MAGDRGSLIELIAILLDNAIKYSPSGSQIRLTSEPSGHFVRLSVADQGDGLAAEQQARAFEKFERLGRSGDGGTGLGLYISRRLARAMGGDLSVESTEGQGATFTLWLPLNVGVAADDAPAHEALLPRQ